MAGAANDVALALVANLCLNPRCYWISLPFPRRIWDRHQDYALFASTRCPRCGGNTLVVDDSVLVPSLPEEADLV